MPEDPEESLFPIDSAPHLDRARVHQIDLATRGITLAEDHVPRPERPNSYVLDLAARHKHDAGSSWSSVASKILPLEDWVATEGTLREGDLGGKRDAWGVEEGGTGT